MPTRQIGSRVIARGTGLAAFLAIALALTASPASAQEDEAPAFPSRRHSSGLGFDLTLGALATKRDFVFAGERSAIEHHPTPYLGGVVRGRQTITTFGERNANLLVELEGGYASARNSAPEPGTSVLLVTEHTYAQALGVLEKPLTSYLDLVLGLGLGATSFTIKQNPRYTGHRYLHLTMRFGATRWFDPWRIFGGLTLHPGIATNQSSGGYGAVRSFGGRLDAGGGWRFYQPSAADRAGSADLELRYAYARFHSTYPESQALGDLSGSSDQNHTVTLSLSYSL